VHFTGAVTHFANSGGNWTSIATVPVGYRSGRREHFPCGVVFGSTVAVTEVAIAPDGQLYHVSAPPQETYTIYLSKVEYRIAALD
jgi:hypothetical protein